MIDENLQKQADLAWRLMTELRMEIITAQQIRAKAIEIKITFVSVTVGLILASSIKLPMFLMAIPSFAAIFFDFLINSYSVSIKRIGFYCRTYIEPKLRQAFFWANKEPLWEEFMNQSNMKQKLSLIGNLGLTAIVMVPTIFALFGSFKWIISLPLVLALVILFVCDLLVHLQPRRIAEGKANDAKKKSEEVIEAAADSTRIISGVVLENLAEN